MPHEHEWYLDYAGLFPDHILMGMCRGCPATLTLKEIENLLNNNARLEKRITVLEEVWDEMMPALTKGSS